MRGRRQLQCIGGVTALSGDCMCGGGATNRRVTAQIATRPFPGDLVQSWVAIFLARQAGISHRTSTAEASIVVALFLRRSHVFGDCGQPAGYGASGAFQSGDCGVGLATLEIAGGSSWRPHAVR